MEPVFTDLRDAYLLNPAVTFLNHGSFGACPKPVFETYQRWQRELESQPVEFLGRCHAQLLDEASRVLADYVGADSQDLIFVPNATTGVNAVARSLDLRPGDEILATDHEYGAMDRTWQFICQKTGAHYVVAKLPVPFHSAEDIVEALWRRVTPRTRAIFCSHITSPTALILPVRDICRRAREQGILTIIDGAHATGQIDLDLTALDADYYTGNCHKWLSAPKGAGFLQVRRDRQATFEPLVISWGWREDATFVERNRWQGTRDIAAFLSIPAAIEFQRAHHWPEVRARCHELARAASARIGALTGLPPLSDDSGAWFPQMVTVPLPVADAKAFQATLYDEYRIEAPGITWSNRSHLRVSFQGYNTRQDLDALLRALGECLPKSQQD